ncbi:HNH endonuclease signature motif containing protein [Noviherbaspirillum malthae]|uniref:HNH endonuclease signature motif containing protein n=1 Tax=Noviherbaspirillum malthae TaxID=1260987 RepID=UPI00189015F1|nr:HNH endonuclease signature motif containing protein [Noviherbaspirillum malthae]
MFGIDHAIVKKRFDAKVRITPGCWLWAGAKNSWGYGAMTINSKDFGAHAVSYALYVGPIAAGMRVLHRCDTPACVNPDHLFLGTQKDNIADMDAKGRRRPAKGVANHFAKLTEEAVRAIDIDPRTYRAIASSYGISAAIVSDIKNRRIWTHLFNQN